MKIRMRSDDASTLHEDSWSQMDAWLASLRDDSRTDPPGDGGAAAEGADVPWSESPDTATALAEARARARAEACAEARARAEADACSSADVCAEATGRAVIGDQLRIPIMWCEMGSCVSFYTDRAALGEADTRARAIGAGWRFDALGRLACPQCQQTDPCFWAAWPVVPWDRYLAIVRAARVAASPAGRAVPEGSGDAARPVSAAASPPEPGLPRSYPAAQTIPVGLPAD
jgi:hypothetical protein